jgi:hypothetical protein
MTFITHGFRVSVVSDVREREYETSGSHLRFMLRRSSLVECVSVLPGNRCLQNNMKTRRLQHSTTAHE